MAGDALVVSRMNVGDGGAQPKMHNTILPGGHVQRMVTEDGKAKGLQKCAH